MKFHRTTLASEDGTSFLKEKLDDLGKRRGQIEESLTALEIEIGEVERDRVDQGLVMQALTDFSEVFAELKPYQQKELMRLVLHKAILGPDCLKLGIYGRPPEVRQLAEGDSRFQIFKWLAGQMSESVVLWNVVGIVAKRMMRGPMRSLPDGRGPKSGP
ncbi:MAG: hypothetical protein ABIJ00_05440 [Candidatus Eisenbacteria bacterium]